MDIQHIWNLKQVGTPTVSSDKQKWVSTLSHFPEGTDKPRSQIILGSCKNPDEIHEVTFGEHRDQHPAWSPDGTRILFLSDQYKETQQVFVHDLESKQTSQLTHFPTKISKAQWLPNSKEILFVAYVPCHCKSIEDIQTFIEAKNEVKSSAKVTEDRLFRFWDQWLTEDTFPQLFLINVTSKDVRCLTPGQNRFFNFDLSGPGSHFDISPDGQSVALCLNTTEKPYAKLRFGVFELNLNSGQIGKIISHEDHHYFKPRYSPSGEHLFFEQKVEADIPFEHYSLIKWNRKSAKEIARFKGPFLKEWALMDDNSFYFLTESKEKNSIQNYNFASGELQVLCEQGTMVGLQFGNGTLLYQHNSAIYPNTIQSLNLKDNTFQILFDPNLEEMKSHTLGRVESMNFTGALKEDVQMSVIFPPDFDEKKKWPLLHFIHGGPHSQFGDTWHSRWNGQYFAALGYVVAMVNYHGSSGFGEEFGRSLYGKSASLPFEDIMRATDELVDRGYIDEERMAASGGSYGGYMTHWIAGHTNRFKALISHAAVYNTQAQYGSDVTYGRPKMFGGTPWGGLEHLDKENPSRFAHNFSTPNLIIHGEKDYRVPIGQALEPYMVLKSMEIPSRLVYFPDENHWILKRENSVLWYDEFKSWLQRFVPSGAQG